MFLRQDRRNVGYDRNPVWIVSDVYHCKKCLAYKKVDVEKRMPRGDGGEWVDRLV